ncbi:hypothetical protein F0562_025303 [Nyssa sinensis]|uniref:Uncharacterized protein n=1 Tax=Nyssa sinensis TaxID=561372 RepID=A0A5J5BGB5_9ASTE|nr:hypothetical protein F0562_025303 [Nyssa sinensis]
MIRALRDSDTDPEENSSNRTVVMSGWISSKLKVAETFLQQIDQQAAESLRNNDKPRSDGLNYETPTKTSEVVPLKDQLKKNTPETNDFSGKLRSDRHNLNEVNNNNNYNNDRDKEVATSVNFKPSSNPKSSLTDTDWTELLSAPSQPTPPAANRTNGVSGVRSLRKDIKSQGILGSNLSALEAKRNQKTQNSVLKTSPKSNIASENTVNGGTRSDGEDTRFLDSMHGNSSVESQSDRKSSEGAGAKLVAEHENEAYEERNGVLDTITDGGQLHSVDSSMDAVLQSTDKNQLLEILPVTVDSSDGGSDSETDSASTSDSESEHEREEKRRREQLLAEKAVAKAVEAIKERENMVARLEGEKQSLEKILEERAKQQAQEASELQTTTMEMMEAVDLEKQKHNNTRMEALPRLAKLETANADLAKSLATAQWNLEIEVNRVSELQQQIDLKEATHEDLRRKISNTHQTGKKVSNISVCNNYDS